MIIDHIGYFLYPGELRFRVIGRMAFPLFFLLIGRNTSRNISRSLMIAAVFVQWALRYLSYVHGYDFRQLNILPAAIIVKFLMGRLPSAGERLLRKSNWIVDQLMSVLVLKKTIAFVGWTILIIICLLLIPTTKQAVEYGSMVLCIAIVGRMIRQYRTWRLLIRIPLVCYFWWLYLINHDFPFTQNQRNIVYVLRIINIIWLWKLSKHNFSIRINFLRDRFVLLFSQYAVRVYIFHFLGLLAIAILRR